MSAIAARGKVRFTFFSYEAKAAMRTLNDLPDEDRLAEAPQWSPANGLVRGALWGLVACLILVALLAPLAWYAPLMVLQVLLRTAIGFGSAWILFGVIQRKTGLVGWPITGLAVAYALLVLFSHHVIFALHGVQSQTGVVAGSVWLNPSVMCMQDLTAFGAIAICAALRHSGSAGAETLVDMLMQSVWPGGR
jgi:hypothetical protein